MARRINAELVMELLGMGMSAREISRTRGIASASVKKVREAAGAAGLAWDDVRAMNEPEVYDLLFPEQARARDAVAEVDYARAFTASSSASALTRGSSGGSTSTSPGPRARRA